MHIESFFDPATSTLTHLVFDPASRQCALIDTVLDYDSKSGRTRTTSADQLVARVEALGATVSWILETHVHADHLTAASYLKQTLGGKTGIGDHIGSVQTTFGQLFNAGPEFATDGRQFDHLFADGETFLLGELQFQALHTPGHTPACVSYLLSDGRKQALFVGDTMFMPDTGSARCDFPGGNARILHRTVRRLLSYPDDVPVYLCHDYPPADRPISVSTTVGEQRAHNLHLRDAIGEDEFVEIRSARDATLEMPVLLLPSVQVNMRAGEFPPAEANGVRYLKIPLNAL